MNVTELARRLRVTPQQLLAKLPELGFDIGARAIKIDDRTADQIYKKWLENSRRERFRDTYNRQQAGGTVSTDADGKPREVTLPAVIAVRDFAGLLNMPVTRVIQQLMKAGILASQNERIDFTTASIIAEELGFKPNAQDATAAELSQNVESEDRLKEILTKQDDAVLVDRPPVVVVMGHVDHGKTRTLDAIRKTNVMEGESGGITQHIGAYMVEKKGKRITFIDTPGHEAFTVMRSRGAKVADIAILVVAADDGVQPQTKEAASIIQAAKLPFVVALNKIDKEDADPNRVLGQLAEIGITVEEWGGKVPMAKISAKNGTGIDDLLELVLLVAEVERERIRANPEALAAGTVIEAHVDKGEGPVATAIVQNGTLRRNDVIGINGNAYGRVRMMKDWNGKILEKATPGMPVKILGFKASPSVGDIIEVPEDASSLETKKVKGVVRQSVESLTATKQQASEDDVKKPTLNIVLKSDVLGSLEAILGVLERFQHEAVALTVVQKGLGNITEADVERAATTKPSVVYAFNTAVPTPVAVSARDKDVEIITTKVIYDLFDDAVVRLNALLPKEVTVIDVGKAEVGAIFRTEPGRMVLGMRVKTGKLVSGAKLRVWRGDEIIGEGTIESLQSGKSATKEAPAGTECGLSYSGKAKIMVGDILDAYVEESKVRKIDAIR
ncbi:MAG: translation initiation factor IF-2 [Patescibacteria group bacterium]